MEHVANIDVNEVGTRKIGAELIHHHLQIGIERYHKLVYFFGALSRHALGEYAGDATHESQPS